MCGWGEGDSRIRLLHCHYSAHLSAGRWSSAKKCWCLKISNRTLIKLSMENALRDFISSTEMFYSKELIMEYDQYIWSSYWSASLDKQSPCCSVIVIDVSIRMVELEHTKVHVHTLAQARTRARAGTHTHAHAHTHTRQFHCLVLSFFVSDTSLS